jgi:periplasmic divalent cation tolerance protein
MHDRKEFDIWCVTTTVGSEGDARHLAGEILSRRLAACVQLDTAVTSLYRWEGRLCEEAEVRLVIKTVAGCLAGLRQLLAELHPYELPQWLAWPMESGESYAAWVGTEVQLPSRGP